MDLDAVGDIAAPAAVIVAILALQRQSRLLRTDVALRLMERRDQLRSEAPHGEHTLLDELEENGVAVGEAERESVEHLERYRGSLNFYTVVGILVQEKALDVKSAWALFLYGARDVDRHTRQEIDEYHRLEGRTFSWWEFRCLLEDLNGYDEAHMKGPLSTGIYRLRRGARWRKAHRQQAEGLTTIVR